MLNLPKGRPVRQQVNPARINLPEAMAKLRSGSFTGYLRFDAPQGIGIVLFQQGKLISAIHVSNSNSCRRIAYDAIARMFEMSILGDARLNIYQLSGDLVVAVHAFLQGRYLLTGEDLQHLDVAMMLERIKNDRLCACIRVSAGEETVLIFYDQGYPLGFFVETATELRQSVDLSTSVAALPGAVLDLVEIRSPDDIVLADLMGSADLGPIWQRARKELLDGRRRYEESVVRGRNGSA